VKLLGIRCGGVDAHHFFHTTIDQGWEKTQLFFGQCVSLGFKCQNSDYFLRIQPWFYSNAQHSALQHLASLFADIGPYAL
jgi:hypothetical protein